MAEEVSLFVRGQKLQDAFPTNLVGEWKRAEEEPVEMEIKGWIQDFFNTVFTFSLSFP